MRTPTGPWICSRCRCNTSRPVLEQLWHACCLHASLGPVAEACLATAQASTDTRPKAQQGKQGDDFSFGNFFKGDLPGKLATILVSAHHCLSFPFCQMCSLYTHAALRIS
jgi:hypothetical protein